MGQVTPDMDLLDRIARRDESALAELYDRFSSVSMALAARIVGDRMEAEDVIQTVFIRVWDGARRYDPARGSVAAWLLQSIRNAAIDRIRRRDAYRRATERAVPPGETTAPAPELNEDQKRLKDAVAQLPADQREVIELAYFEGLSQTQISEKLGHPLGTVKTRIRLGMEKLREALK